VRYGQYVLPALAGTAGGFIVGVVAAGSYWGWDRGCKGHSDCIDLTVLAIAGIGWLGSVAGGIAGVTIRGREKIRILVYTLLGHGAILGGLYSISYNRDVGPAFEVPATMYLLTIPLTTALSAYLIDRAYSTKKRKARLLPVVSVAESQVLYGFSMRF